jgi:hypothetical protein
MPGTTVVACKVPSGLHLDVPNKGRATVRGPAMEVGIRTDQRPLPMVEYAFALTEIDADHWEAWLALHKNTEIVQKGFIFAGQKNMDVKARAREMEKEKTGLEPLDADSPGRGLEKVGVAG